MLKTGYEDFPQYNAILGIDECGYGCGAGALYVTGAILSKDTSDKDFKDSKKLTAKGKKEEVYNKIINDNNILHYTSIVSVDYINKNGMSKAIAFAFQDVVNNLEHLCDAILIDGNTDRGVFTNRPIHTITKGDNTYQNIAVASIISKTSRDAYMTDMANKYPEYGFDNNKGYLTEEHRKALKEYGGTEEHRTQYIRNHI